MANNNNQNTQQQSTWKQNTVENKATNDLQNVVFSASWDYTHDVSDNNDTPRNIWRRQIADSAGRSIGIIEDKTNLKDYEDKLIPSKLDNLDYGNKPDTNYFDPGSTADILQFELPDWGVEDYIRDRNRWIKGIRSVGDEQGWFYFKVFFKFNTNYGLFGGTINDELGAQVFQSNCALRYLNTISPLYKPEKIKNRIIALKRFAAILSQMNTKYPWMISSVSGLDKAMNIYTDKFSEEKSIDIGFNIETTDMKLINMLNLYKYACYDDINCKEIIPENLRKFDMMIIIYHVPIKYFQTAIMTSPKKDISTGLFSPNSKLAKAESVINKTFNFLTTKTSYHKYKRMNPDNNNLSNMLSFNMFTFHGCEFDVESFGKYFEGLEMKNESPFQITETQLKIKYDRSYYHNMNEWTQTLFGSDGFYYDVVANIYPVDDTLANKNQDTTQTENKDDKKTQTQPNYFQDRISALLSAREGSRFFDKNAAQYKSLIDYSESLITDGLMSMDMKNYYAFLNGNLYGDTGVGSKYYKAKLSHISGKTSMFTGNLYGVITAPTGKDDGGYFIRKLRALKDGTIKGNLYDTDSVQINSFNPQIELKSKNNKFDPFTENQKAKQEVSIFNYVKGTLGNAKLKGNNGLFGGAMDAINDIASFWKW